uniref:PBPe domain-containing protein n=1 Tax=Macrostomum lignano TaxID=282301 RepID=A0A1I8HFD1_9PLAT
MLSPASLLCLLLLALCPLPQPGSAQRFDRPCSPSVFHVAVERYSTFVYLTSIRNELTNASRGAFSFNFTHFEIQPHFAKPETMAPLENEFLSRNIYAVVADYYLSVAVVTYTNGIPYFISGDREYSTYEYKPQMFQYQINHDQLNSTLFDLNAALRREGYTIFTDGTLSSSHFTANVAGKIFTQRVINANTSDSEIFDAMVRNRDLLSSHSWVLVYKPENMHQVVRIFNQSGPAGALTDKDIFVLPSLEDKQQYLANIRRSSAIVYTFSLDKLGRYNSTELEKSGYFSYRRGIREGLTVNVMTTERTLPDSDFLSKTGTWIQNATPAYKVDYFKTTTIKNSLIRFVGVLRADMSANFMFALSDRLQAADMSINLVQSGLLMLLKRTIHPLDFFNVFYPFSWYVWISIMFSMVVLSVTLFVSDKISPNKSDKPMFSFMASFFLVLSSFLMSKVETEPRKPSARLFTLLLWFSTLFYMTTYVSNLVPFLVKPDESVPFTTITELQNATSYRAIFWNNSIAYTTVQRRWPNLVQTAKANWPEDMLQPSAAAAVETLKSNDRYVYIDSATTINYQKTKDCVLKTYGPLEEVVYETTMIRKNYPFTNEVRSFLNSVRYSEYQNLEKKYFGLNRCPTSVINPADKIPLSFSYFAGLFAAVGIGSVLGFLYIILHWVYRKVVLWLARRRSRNKLEYGKTYEAEIIKITKEGVWVKIEGRQEVFFIANNSLHSDPTKIKTAKSLQLRVRQKIQVQYFGKDSATNNRIFARLFENSEWLQAERNRVVDSDSD